MTFYWVFESIDIVRYQQEIIINYHYCFVVVVGSRDGGSVCESVCVCIFVHRHV